MFNNEPLHLDCSRIDALANHLQHKLAYKKGERDMVAMSHIIKVEWPDRRKEVISSSLIRYGDDRHSAMAYTVGTPCAIAVQLILNNTITARGVIGPMAKEIYEPVNTELYKEGIRFTEQVVKE
eukprot:NODE_98_length_21025_cov_0.475055.p12 type:complete len:124 gc:universal NODE_98_length_21025_cov_0.475055:5498-5127(-)